MFEVVESNDRFMQGHKSNRYVLLLDLRLRLNTTQTLVAALDRISQS
jgi:hypothetical protein